MTRPCSPTSRRSAAPRPGRRASAPSCWPSSPTRSPGAGCGCATDAVTDTEHARDRLTDERERATLLLASLTRDFDGIVEASADSNADDEHDPEGSTIAFERSQVSTMVEQTRARLADVDDALERVEQGTYGLCERCGRPIPEGRLEARPVARTCVACS
ncbi:molecular chaperone DnaK [Aeromicrobium endophyticum]|uniref:Molecular chaperone DnaK n=1 Tax=Aeromicrobium endophyticum TaxID=2292704 RepID=A0A371P4C3_9ACTN|nr:molecular chaperone DnaK [Aeromicrobium endophyticum]